jgi:hypothetical protein
LIQPRSVPPDRMSRGERLEGQFSPAVVFCGGRGIMRNILVSGSRAQLGAFSASRRRESRRSLSCEPRLFRLLDARPVPPVARRWACPREIPERQEFLVACLLRLTSAAPARRIVTAPARRPAEAS